MTTMWNKQLKTKYADFTDSAAAGDSKKTKLLQPYIYISF